MSWMASPKPLVSNRRPWSRPVGNRRSQGGFSLIEILISILIFSMISIAMLTVFNLSSTIFRETEASRTADDEAAIALAMLEDDLARMVPASNGGWLFAQVAAKTHDGLGDLSPEHTGGSMVIAFTIDVGDALRADKDGKGMRQVVAWWTDDYGCLWRGVQNRNPVNSSDATRTAMEILENDIYNAEEKTDSLLSHAKQQIIRGCLHLSVDISGVGNKARQLKSTAGTSHAWNWAVDEIEDPVLPLPAAPYRTEAQTSTETPDPWPEAICITLITAGGGKKDAANPARYATRGFLASNGIQPDDTDNIRVAGIRIFPAQGGALLRLGDPADTSTSTPSKVEWLSYTGVDNGVLRGVTRAQLRTGADPAHGEPPHGTGYNFDRNTPVAIGRVHSLVRILPP